MVSLGAGNEDLYARLKSCGLELTIYDNDERRSNRIATRTGNGARQQD